MPDDLHWFTSRLRDYVSVTDDQATVLFEHYELLKRWNQRINLTSIKEPDEIVVRHYAESLFFAVHLPDARAGTTIADIGSGAGFPGVPMAVLRPDWSVTLVESHQRKAVFLRESTRGIQNVRVIAERAERLTAQFDWIVSRAVSPQSVLALVPKLSRRVGLLVSHSELDAIGFVLSNAIPIAWADQEICAFNVSRGT